ncbi:MAG: hypothetical protein PHS49_04145 [Candidatus Gracilibacteria bacterium]|nr:hypothetical protein [Candidatus Gracilibacteria bacterium]
MNNKLLENKEFLKWCYVGITEKTLLDFTTLEKLKPYATIEREWGNRLLGTVDNKQWTTKLCENAVKELLENLGYKNVKNARKLKSSVCDKEYNPDFECDDFVWEVKGRSWTTPGTAGEKILGTPLKYSEIPRLYKKPLKIVTVGYQEWEAKNGFACGDLINPTKRGTEELNKMMVLFKKLKIEYVGFTDMLEELNNKNVN